MKLQYLGDSKDSFKWDYHDYLVSKMGFSHFNVYLMMTLDDHGNDGNTHPTLFPARGEIIRFCHKLREIRSVEVIKQLPAHSGASYDILLHKSGDYLDHGNRAAYFKGFSGSEDQLVFLDPDNGFEPENSCTEKHVRYTDVSRILEQVSEESVVSVFQHHRRISFPKDFARIQERLEPLYSTAIHWHSLMFVAVSKSRSAIEQVIVANREYAKVYPVQVIAG